MIDILVKIAKPIYDFLNWIPRPVLSVIIMALALGCYLWIKFDNSKVLAIQNHIKNVDMQALQIHKVDSARSEVKELVTRVDKIQESIETLNQNIPVWINKSTNKTFKKIGDLMIFIEDNQNIGKKAIIDAIHLLTINEMGDTLKYNIVVKNR